MGRAARPAASWGMTRGPGSSTRAALAPADGRAPEPGWLGPSSARRQAGRSRCWEHAAVWPAGASGGEARAAPPWRLCDSLSRSRCPSGWPRAARLYVALLTAAGWVGGDEAAGLARVRLAGLASVGRGAWGLRCCSCPSWKGHVCTGYGEQLRSCKQAVRRRAQRSLSLAASAGRIRLFTCASDVPCWALWLCLCLSRVSRLGLAQNV